MVQVSQHEEAIHALNHIQDAFSSVSAHAFAASATATSSQTSSQVQADDAPATKRVKLDSAAPVDEAHSAASAMAVTSSCNDELGSSVSYADVSVLSLDGLNEAILNPLQVSSTETVFDSANYFSALSSCETIEPSLLPPIGSLQREDSLGLGMAMQEPIYNKAFAAHAFPLTPFNDGQMV